MFPLGNALPPPDQASPEMPLLASSGATGACPQLPRSHAGGPHREAEGLCAACPRKLVTPLFQGPARATMWLWSSCFCSLGACDSNSGLPCLRDPFDDAFLILKLSCPGFGTRSLHVRAIFNMIPANSIVPLISEPILLMDVYSW